MKLTIEDVQNHKKTILDLLKSPECRARSEKFWQDMKRKLANQEDKEFNV